MTTARPNLVLPHSKSKPGQDVFMRHAAERLDSVRHLGPLLVILLAPSVTAGQPASPAIHREIIETYVFSPHELTASQIGEKSAVLDQFWENAKTRKSDYLPALREELRNFGNPPFFLYDGSKLLLAMSDARSDRRIAQAAVAHCDLRDVHPGDYFWTVHRMAAQGDDTSDAALHVLDDPSFRVVVPQHALVLGQNYALVYMLLPVDPKHWMTRATARLAGEADLTARKSLLLLLWYVQTADADAALRRFAAEPGADEARVYARELLSRNEKVGIVTRARAAFHSEAGLRAERLRILQRVSDEALLELEQTTALLLAKRG